MVQTLVFIQKQVRVGSLQRTLFPWCNQNLWSYQCVNYNKRWTTIGNKEYKEQYVLETVQNWIHKAELLSDLAKAFSHEAYTEFDFHYQHIFRHLLQIVPNISNNLKPLEHVIRHKFKKSILNCYECNDTETKLFTLPMKHGDLSIYDPTERWKNSGMVTYVMVEKVKNQKKSMTNSRKNLTETSFRN